MNSLTVRTYVDVQLLPEYTSALWYDVEGLRYAKVFDTIQTPRKRELRSRKR